MLTELSHTDNKTNFISRNIKAISNRPRCSVECLVEGTSVSLKQKTQQQPRPSRCRAKRPAKSLNSNHQPVFDCFQPNFDETAACPVKKVGIRRKGVILKSESEVFKLKAETNIIVRNRRRSKQYHKISYYTHREIFTLAVTTIPTHKLLPPTNYTNKGKFCGSGETLDVYDNTTKPRAEGLRRGGMDRDRGLSTCPSAVVSSAILADNHRRCSNLECSSFRGEATRNRLLPKEYQLGKANLQESETSDEYLQDSYNYVFKRHVDNLNTVISQHVAKNTSDKAKTHVHIRPTEYDKNSSKSNRKKLAKLDIKPEGGALCEKCVSFTDQHCATLSPMNIITEKMQEVNIFEELNNNDNKVQKPVITFNHVLSETQSDREGFDVVNKPGSRSPSPLLEVPDIKETDKESMRPPLTE